MNADKNAGRTRRGTNRLTMQDVARHAGVSASSVSLYFREPDAVSPRLAARIRRAVDELGYVPNLLAGSLAAARSRAIAVVVPSLTNAFFSATVNAMQERLDEAGYQLLLGSSEYSLAREARLVETFLSWSPAAVVLTGREHTPRVRRMLKASGVPVCEMWELGGRGLGLQVGFSHRSVGEALARHLREQGRSRPAFIGARMDLDRRAAQRAQGFADHLEAHAGRRPAILDVPETAGPAAGARACAALLTDDPSLDAICCSNDALALGVLFEAQRRGIRLPQDLALAGFGDLPYCAQAVPPITTVRPPSREIGVQAVERLLQCLDDPARARGAIDLGFTLEVRESTRRHGPGTRPPPVL